METTEIVNRYKSGQFIYQIAEEMYMTKYMVSKVLKENGIEIKRYKAPGRSVGTKHMIVNDWNAGMPIERIARVYGYTVNSAYSMIKRLKQEGWKLVPRRYNRDHMAEDVIADWEAGMDARKMAKKYDFSGPNTLYHFLSQLRKKGYEVEYRNANKR